jgi:ubiquinone/menaquinone biosynthesis C-methylase UbiE
MENIYFDNTYLSNNQDWHQEDAPFKAAKILEIVRQHNLNFKTVCEIGCGSGEILVELKNKLPEDGEFAGFDISPQAFHIAKEKESGRLRFFQKDITKEKDVNFDLLLVIDVFEHIENYFSFLREIRPKGTYTVFHIPLDLSVWTLFREKMLLESKQRVGHIHNFTESFIKSVLEDCGYQIIGSSYTEPTYVGKSMKERIIQLLRKTTFRINQRLSTKLYGGYSLMVLAKN